MKKKIIKILITILVLLLLVLGALCIIDHNKMNNNEEVVFSTWGKKYAPSLERKSEKIVEMYKAIIDDLIKNHNAIYSSDKYISLNVESLKAPADDNIDEYLSLTQDQQNELLEYCQKYNKEVKGLSLEGLRQEGLVKEENGFVSLNGALLEVLQIKKLTQNKAVIWFEAFHSSLGSVMPKYELRYKNGKWEVTVKEITVS